MHDEKSITGYKEAGDTILLRAEQNNLDRAIVCLNFLHLHQRPAKSEWTLHNLLSFVNAKFATLQPL